MNPEIRKLQHLNNLITQTLDVLSRQQANVMPMPGVPQPGLGHTPMEMINPQYQMDPRWGFAVDPRFIPQGLGHTTYDPRINLNYDPRLNVQYDPRINMQYDPRFMVGGLAHTPYDPRINTPMIDPRYQWVNPNLPYNW